MNFVTIEYRKKVPVLVVKYRVKGGEKQKVYALTEEGCRKAGADLYAAGAEDWMHSSSTDFPHEYKPTFRGDVQEYMGEGYKKAQAIAEAPRKSLVAKMMERCGLADFQATLTDAEKRAYVALAERIANEGK